MLLKICIDDAGMETKQEIEKLQELVIRTVSTHPAGLNLVLIGGCRYRWLNDSARMSVDIDFHWEDDPDKKQGELICLFRRNLLPLVLRRHGYHGRADKGIGPDADSPMLRVIDLSFWKDGVPYSRIELPVEITRIICLDPMEVRTFSGTIVPTPSDADMIESKLLALFARPSLMHRDLVDLYLFRNHLAPEASERVKKKCRKLELSPILIQDVLDDLQQHRTYHTRAIDEVMAAQLNPVVRDQLDAAGGGALVLDAVLELAAGLGLDHPGDKQ